MAIDQSVRMKVEAQLRLGKKSKELSEEFGIPYVTIRTWAKKIEAEQADEDVTTMISADTTTLHAMAEEIRNTPGTIVPLSETEKQLSVIEGAIGLQKLEEKSRSVSFKILGNVEKYLAEQELNEELTLKDMKEAAGIVSTLHTAIFSKNVTQVNVLNNNAPSEEKRSIFKSSLRA